MRPGENRGKHAELSLTRRALRSQRRRWNRLLRRGWSHLRDTNFNTKTRSRRELKKRISPIITKYKGGNGGNGEPKRWRGCGVKDAELSLTRRSRRRRRIQTLCAGI